LLCPSAPQMLPTKGKLAFLLVFPNPPFLEFDGLYFDAKQQDPTDQQFVDQLGLTNYLGSAGMWGVTGDPGLDRYRGVFANRSRVRTSDIIDGVSKTLLLGEAVGEID